MFPAHNKHLISTSTDEAIYVPRRKFERKITNVLIDSFFTIATIPLTAMHAISAQTGASRRVNNNILTTVGMNAKQVHEMGILAARLNNAAKVRTLAVNAKRVATAQPIIPYRGMRMRFAATLTDEEATAASSPIYVAETVCVSAA